MRVFFLFSLKIISALSFCFVSVSLFANQNFVVKGGSAFTATFASKYEHIDNYLYSAADERSTMGLHLSPAVHAQIQHGRQLFKLDASLEHTSFENFSKDNHTDHALSSALHYKFAHNLASYLKGNIKETSENRGQGISYGGADDINDLDVKQSQLLGAGLLYGSEYSSAKAFVELDVSNSKYKTRRDLSNVFDEQALLLTVGFDYLMSGQSYFATETQVKKTGYAFTPEKDKYQYTLLSGYKWESTAITQVELLLGYEEISFVEKILSDESHFKWRINIQWHPLEQFKLMLATDRNTGSTNKVSNSYRVTDVLDTSLWYLLNERFSMKAGFMINNSKIIYQQDDEYENERTRYLQINYQFNQRYHVLLKYQKNVAEHSIAENNFSRTRISLSFDVII